MSDEIAVGGKCPHGIEFGQCRRCEQASSFAAPAWLERSDVIQAIMDEECFDGPMPDEIWERMQTREGAEEILRATVRRVQFNITKRLRSNGALSDP